MALVSAPIYSARGVLNALARVLGCEPDDVENELERRFEVELPFASSSEHRLEVIRKNPVFNPGEGNNIVEHIYQLVKHDH